MEFLHSLLKRHFAGKPVATSQNVGCVSGVKSFIVKRKSGSEEN